MDSQESNKGFSDDEKRAAVERLNQGEPIDRVAEDLHVHSFTLHRWKNEFTKADQPQVKEKERKMGSRIPEKDKAWALKQLSAGVTHREIAEALGIGISTVGNWAMAANKEGRVKKTAKATEAKETPKAKPAPAAKVTSSTPVYSQKDMNKILDEMDELTLTVAQLTVEHRKLKRGSI